MGKLIQLLYMIQARFRVSMHIYVHYHIRKTLLITNYFKGGSQILCIITVCNQLLVNETVTKSICILASTLNRSSKWPLFNFVFLPKRKWYWNECLLKCVHLNGLKLSDVLKEFCISLRLFGSKMQKSNYWRKLAFWAQFLSNWSTGDYKPV